MQHTESEDTQQATAPDASAMPEVTVEIAPHFAQITLEFEPDIAASLKIPGSVMDKLAVEWIRSHPRLATQVMVHRIVEDQAKQAIILDGRHATVTTAQGLNIDARIGGTPEIIQE